MQPAIPDTEEEKAEEVMQEHHIIAIMWFVLLMLVVPALALYEAIENFIKDAKHNRQRVRELNQQNYELRDEIARLTRHR